MNVIIYNKMNINILDSLSSPDMTGKVSNLLFPLQKQLIDLGGFVIWVLNCSKG